MSTPIARAIERAKRAARLSRGSIMVALSGGKDSLATLDVVVRSEAFSRIEAFAMYVIPGLEIFENPVRRAALRFGIKVHFVPHWQTSRLLRNSVLRLHTNGAQHIRQMRLRDVERALTHKHGFDWFAYGERATDSIARRLYTREVDGVHPDWQRLWPIWDWKDAEVKAYLRSRKIPIPNALGNGTQTGISMQPVELIRLKQRSPSDYEKLRAVFPFVDLQIERFNRGDFNALPKFQRRATAPELLEKRAVQPARHHRAREEEATAQSQESGASGAPDLEP